MLCFGRKEMVKELNGPSGREAAEMWVWPSSCHSVHWAGTRWRAQHLSLPPNGRCAYPLLPRQLQARRGPFCAKDRSGHVSVTCCRSDWTCCETVHGCRNGLDMLHAGKRITQTHQRTKIYAVKTEETAQYLV